MLRSFVLNIGNDFITIEDTAEEVVSKLADITTS
jgi:hypothetical protein